MSDEKNIEEIKEV